MSEFFVRVPNDGAGKAIRHEVQIEVDYVNKTGEFVIDETVTFITSQVTGKILLDHVGIQHTENHLHIKLTHGSPTDIQEGENMQVNGVTIAQAGTSTIPFYIPSTIAVGGNNPTHLQYIDKKGSSSTRFDEGSPRFDSFGRMQVSNPTTIGDYSFNYDGRNGHFTDTATSFATVTHDQTVGCIILTNTTDSGDLASRRTDVHHKYIPGQSQLLEMTVACGDAGKANQVRRWGLFTDNDGLFFRQHGDMGDLDLVIRSSVTGSVVENIVHQAEWNTDRLDGSGDAFNISGYLLDTTKDNIYWIDYQWLGAGNVRFGVEIAGERITCHSWNNSNVNNVSYMRTGSLPICVEQENTGSVGSISELRWFCGTVKSEGSFMPHMGQFNMAGDALKAVTAAGGRVPLMSIRPRLNYQGKTNKIMILPNQFSGMAVDTATKALDGYVRVELWKNAVLTDSTWLTTVSSNSGAEIDTGATALSGGRRVVSMMMKGNDFQLMGELFNYLHENLINKQDGTQQHYTIAVTPMTGVDLSIAGSLSWNEVRD